MSTYSSKSNAIRAFKAKFPDVAAKHTNEQIVELGYVDEDSPGKWEVNDPAVISAEDDFEAEAAAEFAKRQQIAAEAEQARKDEEARIEREHPMVAGKVADSQFLGASPNVVSVHNTSLNKAGTADGKCPHCGVSTRNGKNVTEYSEMSPGSQNSTTQQYTCNECAGEWGPVVDKPKRARAPSGSSNGLKIEANRETRNGVTRPSAGGKCRGIWDMLDGMGTAVTAKEAREAGAGKFDKTTIMVQFYRWRKFNGIEGRQ